MKIALKIAILVFILPFVAVTVLASEIPIDGTVSTFAGTGMHGASDGTEAQFNLPYGIFGGNDGQLIVLDTYNNLIRSIDRYGVVERISGDVLLSDRRGFPTGRHRDGSSEIALFNRPVDGILCQSGRLFIVDGANHAIRIIDEDEVYTFIGGRAGFNNGHYSVARFNWPSAAAVDRYGNLYVADTLNHTIRRIDHISGRVTTLAGVSGSRGYADGEFNRARFNSPMGIAVSPDGQRVYVADTGNHVIRVIENRQVSTLAGTIAYHEDYDDSIFNFPQGLALTGEYLIVADSANHRIQMVSTLTGYTVTLAGTGEPGYVNGPANTAQFHFPRGVYVRDGSLYITDTGNNVIRVIEVR